MSTQRFVNVFTDALAFGGTALLLAVLFVDRTWLDLWLAVPVLAVAATLLRGFQVQLSKYSYLTQSALVSLAGGLLVGIPATALALTLGTLAADWVWMRKALYAAWVNVGREVISLLAAFGVFATAVKLTGVTGHSFSLDGLPALTLLAISFFLVNRTLFYFTLMVRGKLAPDEWMLIVRYECIAYATTLAAVLVVVGGRLFLRPIGWLFAGMLLLFLGLIVKRLMEEAIAAEELNKIRAMDLVITANVSLEDSFRRIERLAHRLLDWGDFRIYRRGDEGEVGLAYRSVVGRANRAPPTADAAALRRQVVESQQPAVVEDTLRDPRIADAPMD
ncbi:MAG: hypothetical protein ACREN5_00940, partial [Gemmatimonadales bacterium]